MATPFSSAFAGAFVREGKMSRHQVVAAKRMIYKFFGQLGQALGEREMVRIASELADNHEVGWTIMMIWSHWAARHKLGFPMPDEIRAERDRKAEELRAEEESRRGST
jgi:hypothetical protein